MVVAPKIYEKNVKRSLFKKFLRQFIWREENEDNLMILEGQLILYDEVHLHVRFYSPTEFKIWLFGAIFDDHIKL